ncbi:MAG TPA: alpha/beta hydrolase [Thermoleophilaceae bacterium]|jgi:pimeloyl-ACP methyl ester carboxylesterase
MAQGAEVREGTVRANGIEFATIEAGEGPLVLLLHGFPDNPWTYEAQIGELAANGYRAVAPHMRGYPPTGSAPDGRYDSEALAGDIAGLVRALGDGPAYVIGNDWGAIATYAAMSLHPETISRAVVINVGHPSTFLTTLLHPHQVHHIFHFWFFQLGPIATGAVRANDLAFVDYLWDYWSAPGHDYADHLARVKRTLEPEGAVEAATSYYSGLLNMPTAQPDAAARMQGRITVPTLSIFGDHDPVRELSRDEHEHFDADYRLEIVEGAGHFVHRERPDQVNRLVLDWLGAAR